MRILLFTLVVWLLFRVCQTTRTVATPNILLIVADDMGYTDLGCYGNAYFETPHLDKLATEGVRFTNAYATCPVCSPSRASFLTGRYPARIGLTNFIKGLKTDPQSPVLPADYIDHLPLSEHTIAEMLKESGYQTALIGKWHLGENTQPEKSHPQRQGFDIVQDFDYGLLPRDNSYDWFKVGDTLNALKLPQLNAKITQHTLDFLRQRQHEKPFFLMMTHYAVHLPLQASPKLVEKYRRKPNPKPDEYNPIYAAMMEEMDASIGVVLAELDKQNLRENTLIIFVSDNGGLVVDEAGDKQPTTCYPLRNGKGTLYEGGVRVACLMSWRGKITPLSVSDAIISGVDLYPTLLEMVQGKKESILDGSSFGAVFTQKVNKTVSNRPIFWHYPHFSNQGGRPSAAVRQGDYKLIVSLENGATELYNLKNDIGEKNNLATIEPDKTAALKLLLSNWQKQVKANMPKPNLTKK
ncbi:sulfatase [Runella zeae]|uniref:sulfatase n=1 Tax=Runella zeae TaxID=94255 RepID=UPI0004037FB2|nr:sulfatase [Runella zeae]